jgi:hypothetical protein
MRRPTVNCFPFRESWVAVRRLTYAVLPLRVRTSSCTPGTSSLQNTSPQGADIYERIGDRPDEAYARLREAECLLADGRRGAAREHLDRSLAFFRSVGATAYEREAEALSG